MTFDKITIMPILFLLLMMYHSLPKEICQSDGEQQIELSGTTYNIKCEIGPLQKLWAVILQR